MAFSRASEDDASCHGVTRDVTAHRSYSESHIHRVVMETSCALHRWESSPGHLSADQCYFVLSTPPCLSVRSVGTQTVQHRNNTERQRIVSRSEGPLPDLVLARSLNTSENTTLTTTDVGRVLRRLADDFESSFQPRHGFQEYFTISWVIDLCRRIFR